MNEDEWLSSDDPAAMLRAVWQPHLRPRVRLFGAACCRRVAHRLPDEDSREALAICERHADGAAGGEDFTRAQALAQRSFSEHHRSAIPTARLAAGAVRHLAQHDGDFHLASVEEVRSRAARAADDGVAERAWQCQALRCLFGGCFGRVRLPPSCLAWGDGLAAQMARMIAQEQRWQEMPVLGDVLEDAGCRAEALLAHCRAGGAHLARCWALEAVLGRG
jgi:hypothetical protein